MLTRSTKRIMHVQEVMFHTPQKILRSVEHHISPRFTPVHMPDLQTGGLNSLKLQNGVSALVTRAFKLLPGVRP